MNPLAKVLMVGEKEQLQNRDKLGHVGIGALSGDDVSTLRPRSELAQHSPVILVRTCLSWKVQSRMHLLRTGNLRWKTKEVIAKLEMQNAFDENGWQQL